MSDAKTSGHHHSRRDGRRHHLYPARRVRVRARSARSPRSRPARASRSTMSSCGATDRRRRDGRRSSQRAAIRGCPGARRCASSYSAAADRRCSWGWRCRASSTSASRRSRFLFYTYPAWVTLVQTVRGAEAVTVRRLAALALSFGGIVVIGLARRGSARRSRRTRRWTGVALALGAAIVYGMYIPLMQWMQKSHPVAVTSAYAKDRLRVLLPAARAEGSNADGKSPGNCVDGDRRAHALQHRDAGVFFLMGLMRLGAVRTAIVSTVEPFLTAILARSRAEAGDHREHARRRRDDRRCRGVLQFRRSGVRRRNESPLRSGSGSGGCGVTRRDSTPHPRSPAPATRARPFSTLIASLYNCSSCGP